MEFASFDVLEVVSRLSAISDLNQLKDYSILDWILEINVSIIKIIDS